jgi:putative oxidoreductase
MSTLARSATRDANARATQDSPSSIVKHVSELAGRSLLAVLFLLSGLGKIGAYDATATYMSSAGVPGALLPNQIEMIMFLKNVSIAGGFLLLVANGAGRLSLDHRLATRA